MRRADRLFQIIQILRRANGAVVTAQDLAEELEVSKRTIYRDMADLQAQRVPIDGEAGLGFMLRGGYELPPLMFNEEELEALVLGARITQSWGDKGLAKAAEDVLCKIENVLPERMKSIISGNYIFAPSSSWQIEVDIDLAKLRRCIRGRQKIAFDYKNGIGDASHRVIWPLAMVFFGQVWNILGWCELRNDFRAFRPDRMQGLHFMEEDYPNEKGRRLIDYIEIEKKRNRAEKGDC